MNFKTLISTLCVVALSTLVALADPPGGMDQGGGFNPGGDDSQHTEGPSTSSGNAEGTGSFSFESIISIATNENCLVRGGLLYGYTDELTTSVAPNLSTITTIAQGCFAGNTAITSVDLSSTSITAIPSDCFAGCTALTSVTLPESCIEIDANAFAGCSALASVSLPATLGAYAFAASGVTSVDLEGVTPGEGTFANCTLLARVDNLPEEIPVALFAGDDVLETCDVSGVTSFGDAAFSGCDALTTLELKPSAALGAYSFAAGSAYVKTTLSNDTLPEYDTDDYPFLAREYKVAEDVYAAIDAMDLVEWLTKEKADTVSTVTQPDDYNTSTLKTWLADSDNAYMYVYADDLVGEDFIALTMDGSNFIFNAPADSALSIGVELVGCYSLSLDESDWSADNLAETETSGTYEAAEESDTCFARLRYFWTW